MTLTRHENGAGAMPTCGRRRRRTALLLTLTLNLTVTLNYQHAAVSIQLNIVTCPIRIQSNSYETM